MCKRAYKTALLLLALLFVVAVAVPASAAPPRRLPEVYAIDISISSDRGARDVTTYYFDSSREQHMEIQIPAHLLNASDLPTLYITFAISTQANELKVWSNAPKGGRFSYWNFPPWDNSEHYEIQVEYYPTKEEILLDQAQVTFVMYRKDVISETEEFYSEPVTRSVRFYV